MASFEDPVLAYDAIYNDFLLLVKATDGANVLIDRELVDPELLAHRELLLRKVREFMAVGVKPSYRLDYPKTGTIG